MKRYKPRDKVTQKMTREGAVNQNQATGESENISQKEKQADFSGRLHFTEEERAMPELERYIRKSEKAADKLDEARENIPTKKKLTRKRLYDEAAGRGKTRLRFEEVEKPVSDITKTNPLSRFLQKQQIKRSYAKDLKKTGKTAQKTGQAAKATARKTAEAGGKTVQFVAGHWKGALIVLAVGLLIMILAGGISSCSNLFIGGLAGITATTYPSEEQEMTAVEASYAAKEQDLQAELDNYEARHPGYDEYRYKLDGIYHDPHQLAAYLSAYFGGAYTLSGARTQIQAVFDLQYELTETETSETRYRTETRTDTWTDEDGNTHTDTYEVEVPYTYYIVTVTLKNRGLDYVAEHTLNADQLEMYRVYRESSGNMPLLFGGGSTDLNPSTDLSGVEFVDGTRPGSQAIVDLAKSQVGNVGGQPYWSWYGFNSRVEWCACFVSWCISQAGYSEPRFAACQSQGVPWFKQHGQWAAGNYTDIAPGDVIFFDWDGGGADHVGLVIGTDGTNVYTVEGNSGDACKIKSYPLTSPYIYGYGLMNW